MCDWYELILLRNKKQSILTCESSRVSYERLVIALEEVCRKDYEFYSLPLKPFFCVMSWLVKAAKRLLSVPASSGASTGPLLHPGAVSARFSSIAPAQFA